jgi:putative ABC transport system ATP-binding protein
MIADALIERNGRVDGSLASPVEEAAVAIRLRGVCKTFGTGEQTVQALRGIDWDVLKGQLTMLVGPSGCGKTTLLSVVAGILDCDRGGTVEVFGSDVARMSGGGKTRFRMDHIGFVFQQYNLLPALTATENAAVPLIIAGVKRKRALERAREVLTDLGVAKRMHSLPAQLSGGQQQRVAIARALVHEPRLIVCDEPTAALDHETGQAVLLLMRQSAVKADRAVLIVSHDSRVFHFADRMARMDDGRIVQIRSQEACDQEPRSDDVWVEAARA